LNLWSRIAKPGYNHERIMFRTMARTWICDKCGRANGGDLCPGCAEPRPIRVRFWFIGHVDGVKGVQDDVSVGTTYAPLAILLVGSILVSILVLLGQASWAVLVVALALGGVYWLWRTVGIGPRLAYYHLLKKLRRDR